MQTENSLIGGRYRLGKKIGQGGFARVFLATDSVLERQVAVKILNSDLTEEKDFLERFGKEARAIATLEHPNILGIYDYGQLSDTAFIVMPYVEGGSLHDKLRRDGLFSPPQAGYFLAQAAAALDYAHRRNLVHRDVKPQNMLLRSEDDRLLLTDFGISKILSSASAQSRTGIMGTLSYMSPEQLSGNVGRGTDVYALGCVLFQMLTGKLPYGGPTEQVIMGHMVSPIPSIVERSQFQLPPSIQGIIEKALAKKIEDRYQSAGEMSQAFQAILNGSTTIKPETLQPPPTWNANLAQPPTQPYSPSSSGGLTGPTLPVPQALATPFQTGSVQNNAGTPFQGWTQPPTQPTVNPYDQTQLAGPNPTPAFDRNQAAPDVNPSDRTQVSRQPNSYQPESSRTEVAMPGYPPPAVDPAFAQTQVAGVAHPAPAYNQAATADQSAQTEVVNYNKNTNPNQPAQPEPGPAPINLPKKLPLGLIYFITGLVAVAVITGLLVELTGRDTGIYFGTGAVLGVILALVLNRPRSKLKIPLIIGGGLLLILTLVFGMQVITRDYGIIEEITHFYTPDVLPFLPAGMLFGVGLVFGLPWLAAKLQRAAPTVQISQPKLLTNFGLALVIGLVASGLIATDVAKSPAALAKQGESLSNIGKNKEASEKYRAASRLDPGNFVYQYNLAAQLNNARRFNEAEVEFKEVVRLRPNDYHYWLGLGNVQIKLRKFAEAEATYQQALQVGGSSSSFVNEGLAEAQVGLGKFEEAGATLEKIAAISGSKSEFLLKAGKAYERAGNYTRSRQLYQQVIEDKAAYSYEKSEAQDRLKIIRGK
jgi:serine/threonine protein kinase/predicted Zn-dependent protease